MIFTEEDKQKINKHIDKTDKCWNWTGYITNKGYGQVWLDKKVIYAHRAVYELLVGEIPKGLQIDHLCRNKKCVNPDHLEAVTQKVNILRGFGTGAISARRTCCHKCGGELTKARYGYPWRECIPCYNARQRPLQRARYKRNKLKNESNSKNPND